MQDILFLFLTAGFVSFLLAVILLTIYKGKIAYNERVTMYFYEPMKKQKEDRLRKSKENPLSVLFKIYWNKGTKFLNQKVSKDERKKLDMLLRDAGAPFK